MAGCVRRMDVEVVSRMKLQLAIWLPYLVVKLLVVLLLLAN